MQLSAPWGAIGSRRCEVFSADPVAAGRLSSGQPDPSTHGTGVYVSHIAPAPRRHATPSREPPAVSAPPRRASASSGPNQAYLGVASRSAVHRQVEAEVSGGDSRQPVSKCPNRPKTRTGWGSRITGRSACRGRGTRPWVPQGVPACPVPGLPYLPSHTHKDTPAGFVHLEYTPTGRQVLLAIPWDRRDLFPCRPVLQYASSRHLQNR